MKLLSKLLKDWIATTATTSSTTTAVLMLLLTFVPESWEMDRRSSYFVLLFWETANHIALNSRLMFEWVPSNESLATLKNTMGIGWLAYMPIFLFLLLQTFLLSIIDPPNVIFTVPVPCTRFGFHQNGQSEYPNQFHTAWSRVLPRCKLPFPWPL